MKKVFLNIIIILIGMLVPNYVWAISTTEATEEIDMTKNGSLTLNYYYDNYNFDNIDVKVYYIASVTNDFQYELASNFSNYQIQINGLETAKEWDLLEQTLDAYIEADSINADVSKLITDNMVKLENLETGLYFIKTSKIDTDDYTLLFDSFLISIPNLGEDGTWIYDVAINPKALEYIPKYEQIEYTIIKEWIDDGKNRPQSIDVEIYEDGTLIDKQILSNTNNWTYHWVTDDDGSIWTVVERNIPDNYTVSINEQKRNFIIINKDSNYKEKNPETLDDIKLYLYIFIGSLVGIIILIISIYKMKKND